MKTKDEILKKLREQLPYLRETYGVNTIGLFGSYSRGEQNTESDVDLFVRFERPIGFFKFIALEDYLSERLGLKTELVTEDALKPLIKPSVMRDVVYV
jgi:predicted nucleotidyltransferase